MKTVEFDLVEKTRTRCSIEVPDDLELTIPDTLNYIDKHFEDVYRSPKEEMEWSYFENFALVSDD